MERIPLVQATDTRELSYFMQLAATDISIAVTVYRRLEYLEQALSSAVGQTVPVRVTLYDDGCDNPSALNVILAKFGDRVAYRRNPRSLGLFGNMNACIDKCDTLWLSILHDDDALAPDFVEKILAAAPSVPTTSLFFGGTVYLTAEGLPFHRTDLQEAGAFREIPPEEFALRNFFPFPGQLLNVADARACGGFPTKSIYTGDWELWFRLAMMRGAIQLNAHLGLHRTHLGAERGTTASAKSGRRNACCGMQVKRNLSRLRRKGVRAEFDRTTWLKAFPPLYRDLLVYSWRMPRWLLRYNMRLLLLTEPRGRASKILHWASRVFGWPALRLAGLARIVGTRMGVKSSPTF